MGKELKNRLKIISKDFSIRLGVGSLVILFLIGEGMVEVLSGVLDGPGNLSAGKVAGMGGGGGIKNFKEYYNELRGMKLANLHSTLWRLQQKGLIEKNGKRFKLTKLGAGFFKGIKEGQEREWDGKWRMVIFDIPERIKKDREWVRRILYELEFRSIQKSVFIGKYPLKKKVYQEIERRGLDKYINLLSFGEIDDESFLGRFS